ncbi:hypothetical protein PAECIP112173_02932 [Paenibacillus sp. JJ-100]|uniref:hypothetical protein n=1 Tax=Paenibacillus sp. JJ-100 TaxID=2974896 RepID=UPI0022FF6D44|nr:hypothetical protein [Paenibacillus sp. JJ-100]CAI6080574.1 hypothetical protein PAECIP112173_02932 [Paenibacillus sp. JJ-100]
MKKIIIGTMIGAMLLSGCGANNSSIRPAKVEENKSPERMDATAPDILLSESSNKKAAVYGVQEEGDLFSRLAVVIDGERRVFQWSNVTNPSFYPQISVVDLNEEGKEEVVIVLTKGTGTGIRDSEVHVLQTDFTEIPVSNPIKFVQDHIQIDLKTDKEKEVREYTVMDNTQKHVFKFNESDANQWYDQPTFRNILRFGTRDQGLMAEIPIQISEGNYLGDAVVRYELVDGKLEPSELRITKER